MIDILITLLMLVFGFLIGWGACTWFSNPPSINEIDVDEPPPHRIWQRHDGEWCIKLGNKTYVGSHTVFHSYPDGKRANSLIERRLDDLLKKHEFQEKT